MIITVIIFILILGLLIFAHELGHFLLAKRNGVAVEEFGFGFPPKIWSKKVGETTYSLNAIPLGGFVKLLGEDGGDVKNSKSFSSKSVWSRFKILFAGVFFNIILAIVVLSIYFWAHGPTITVDPGKYVKQGNYVSEVVVMQTEPGSPAEVAGIKANDVIEKVDNNQVDRFSEISAALANQIGRPTMVTVLRDGKETNLEVTPVSKDGKGYIGIAGFDSFESIKYPFYLPPYLAIRETAGIFGLTVNFIYTFFKDIFVHGKVQAEGTVGPVGIFVLTSEIIRLGFTPLLRFIALLSINLAIINVLPFPALDGGRILFLVIEKIRRGKKMKPAVESAIHLAGFVIIILLVALITYRDVIKFIIHK